MLPEAACHVMARRMSGMLEGFSGFAMSPMRRMDLASFFNEGEEFAVACGAKQRRRGHRPPGQLRNRAGEFLEFANHPLVNRRVGDDAGTLVGLCFACFELGFNQRDDSTCWPQQGNSGRENLAK